MENKKPSREHKKEKQEIRKDGKEKRRIKQDHREETKGNRNNNIYEMVELIIIMNWLNSVLYENLQIPFYKTRSRDPW